VTTTQHALIYESGKWEIDLAARELRSQGIRVPIGSRAFDIIEVLVQASGEVVTKGQLMAQVWPGVVVEDHTLQIYVSSVRRALGEDRGILMTASGRGYYLLGNWTCRRAHTPIDDRAETAAQCEPSSGNLPQPGPELIGRSSAIEQLRHRMSAYRMVTLTGPGGIGKSSLALDLARGMLPDFRDGCWLVELASLSNPILVPSVVASALALEIGGRLSPETVARAIGRRALVLLLDNCEHLIDAAARIAESVTRVCPNAVVLATSRELLRIEGESVFHVLPLDVPPEQLPVTMDAVEHSAVKLFVARIGALGLRHPLEQGDFDIIAAICRRLDGIPLAIEFAAAHAAALGLKPVLSRLESRFELLKGNRRTALPRHQTLRATIDWSYELLTETERHQLRCLAVFVGGFTLEAATAVTNAAGSNSSAVAQTLVSLVSKSLVTPEASGNVSRWRLLETIRAYALERLDECGGIQEIAQRHAEYYRNLVLPGAPASTLSSAIERISALSHEIDNVRAALDWAFGATGDVTIGVILTAAYVPVWLHFSLLFECRERAERALANIDESRLNSRLTAELKIAICVALLHTTAVTRGIGVALANALEASEMLDDVDLKLRALWAIWTYRFNNGEYLAAQPFAERFSQLAISAGCPADVLVSNRLTGNTIHFLGYQFDARRNFERVLDLYVAPDDHRHSTLFNFDQRLLAQTMLSRVLWLQGFQDQSKASAQAALTDALAADRGRSLYASYVLGNAICLIELVNGDLLAAEQSIDILVELAAHKGASFWKARAQCLKAILLIKRCEFVTGSMRLRAALDTFDRDDPVIKNPEYLGALAEGLAGMDRIAEGLITIDVALQQADREGCGWCIPELHRIKGDLLLQEARDQSILAAEDCFSRALEEARRQGALLWELRTALSLARLRVRQDRVNEARRIVAPIYGRFTEGFQTKDLRSARALLQ
jgi:predicted ATPase/DNA-binding winged helix-turn-helix (wHTH) protein